MDFLIIIFALFMIAFLIYGGINLWLYLSDVSEEKTLKAYYSSEKGKNDISRLESFMVSYNIPLPSSSKNEVGVEYMRSMLYHTESHFNRILDSALCKAGYKNYFKLDSVGRVYYNSRHAMIYHNVFIENSRPSVKSGVVTYSFQDAEGNRKHWTLSQFFEQCQKIENTPYKEFTREVNLEDLYWFVIYPSSAGHRLADKAAGAVIGGVLLGPVGALAGGMSASSSQKKEENAEIEVVFGQKSEGKTIISWSVAKGDIRSEHAIEELTKHLPNNRLADAYRNRL